MTRKDYERIAAIFRNSQSDSDRAMDNSTLFNLACDFAENFEAENPRFDRGRFLNACGLEE